MDGWGFLEKGAELARRGESFALATVVWRQGPSSGKESCRAIITASGQLHGWIGGACAEPVVIRQAREVIAEGVPRLLLLGTAEQFGGPLRDGMNFVPISCQSEGSLEVYIEPVHPAPHLFVVGHSPMARTLAELARVLGWRADVIAGEAFTAADATERSIVVVATQGHHDEEAVTEAIAARPAYVGLVGSARRGAAVLGYLAERGVPQGDLDQGARPGGPGPGPDHASGNRGRDPRRAGRAARRREARARRGRPGVRPPRAARRAAARRDRRGRRDGRALRCGGRRGSGVRDDGHRRAVRVPAERRRRYVLLLLRRLPQCVREGPGGLPRR